MTSLPGHTLQLATQIDGMGKVRITLECACRRLFAAGLFPVDDPLHRQTIRDEGWTAAQAHLNEERGTNSAEPAPPRAKPLCADGSCNPS